MLNVDVFRPKREPERSIYDAFQREAEKRSGRSVDEFVLAERNAILQEAEKQAAVFGLKVPTADDIIKAESWGMGHIDYAAKLVYKLVDTMRGK